MNELGLGLDKNPFPQNRIPVPSYVYLESYINDDTNPKENRHFTDLLYVDTKSIVYYNTV